MRRKNARMWTDKDLPPEIVARIEPLCAEGDALAHRGQATEAIQKFSEAFLLLPVPPHRWMAATWILIAIGDTAFLAGDMRTAGEALREISLCEGWHANPFVWLRRGQVAYELGDMKKASDGLASAFMLGGYAIFDREDDKYPEFLLPQMAAPVPPVPHRLAHLHKPDDEPAPGPPPKRPWWKFW